ncbi:MAG: hypothetical protein ACXWAC_02800 [Usitatibacter sp.]
MPNWSQRSPLILALALLAAALVAVIAVELGVGGLSTSIPGQPSKRASPAEAKLLPPIVAAAPEQVYPEMGARPLFTPTRRPAPEAIAQNALVRGQFILLGITVAGDTRIAMLREKASGRLYRAERGKEVNGIKVTQIEPENVTLGQGDDKEVLTLQVQKPVGAAAGAAPGAASVAPPSQGPFAVAPAQVQAPNIAVPPGGFTGQPPVNPAGAPAGVQQSSISPGSITPVPPSSAANPSSPQVPQSTAPMSPEELLARRRARRTQQTQ